MVRALGCVLASLSCGCLMPNPAYLGDEGGSGGEVGTASSSAEASSDAGTASGVDTLDTVAGDGTTSTASGDASSSTGGGGVNLDPACPDDDALSACFLFDVDDPAAVIDQSPQANPVTIVGGALVASPWNRAFAFDADTQLAFDCPTECLGGEQVTFEAWVRVDQAPASRSGIVDHNGLLGAFVTDALALRCNSQGGAAEGGSIPLAAWTHVACVADGEVLRAYLDGEVVAERDINPLTPVGEPTLVLGNDSPSFAAPLLGALDRVRVWDTARSSEQVAQAATP